MQWQCVCCSMCMVVLQLTFKRLSVSVRNSYKGHGDDFKFDEGSKRLWLRWWFTWLMDGGLASHALSHQLKDIRDLRDTRSGRL